MFCIFCGKPLAEGETCNCRTAADNAMNNNHNNNYEYANFTPPVYNTGYNDAPGTENESVEIIRKTLDTPAAVFFPLFLTIAFVLKLIGGFEFDILLFLCLLGGWIIRKNVHSRNTRFRTGGFNLISATIVVNIICHCIFSVAAIAFLLVSLSNNLADKYANAVLYYFSESTKYSVEFTPLANIAFCLIIVACLWFVLFYYITLKNNISYIKKTVGDIPGKGKFSAFPNIVLIIHGIMDIAVCALIFMASAIFIEVFTDLATDFNNYILNFVSMGIKYMIPASMALTGLARIIAGINLQRLRSKLKKAELQ